MKKTLHQNLMRFSKHILFGACLAFVSSAFAQDLNNGLKLHYTFDPATVSGSTVPDASGNGYSGTLYTATCGLSNGKNSLILGTTGTGYLDMGAGTGALVSTLTDFSMSCYVWVNSTYASLGSNGNMIATFSNSLDSYNQQVGYMFLQAKRSRYAITTARYETEQATQTGTDVAKGKWVQLTYTQTGTTGKMYIDGVLKNTNIAVTLTPSSLGATAYNMLAKPSYSGDKYLQDAQIADFRIYNRAVTSDEVLMLNGYSSTLIAAYNNLTITGDLAQVKADLTLPTVSGTIPVTWTTTLPATVATDGKVNRPEQYDTPVKLSATMSEVVNGVTYTLTKTFNVTVIAFNVVGEQLAKWDFASNRISDSNGAITAKDSISGFVGTLMNDASIRTIGATDRFNVLDLGNGTGYFDMGTEIGKAIYSLSNYTMCGYFRVDDTYAELNSNGNFIWNFSNSADAPTDMNGYIIGSLKAQSQSITTNYWQVGNQAVGANANATKGGWHHFAYTQNGTTGTVYVDGASVATGSITNLPSTALLVAGRTGTLYNWLGRSCYPGDVYLRNTLLYDFQLLRVPLTADDLNFGFEVPATIDRLNVAYAENPKVILTELTTEMDNLSLGDLSAVTSDITLPAKGTKDANIAITWKSTNANLISATGVVTRPNYYSYPDTLTATLSKNGQKVFKVFPARVVAKAGSEFTNNLLVKFDFATVADSVVTDAAEKHFTGVLKNKASIRTIGSTVKYNVLSLGDSIGYFDMGPEVGKLMYNLTDYTVGAYFRIDTAYTAIASNGNFLWNFSNSKDIINNPTGYIIGSLRNQANTITPTNWTPEQTVAFQSNALKGGWHYFGYTQSGTTGTVYIDGMAMATSTITSLPATTLPKQNQLGTLYNWIGRSCYTGDVYLRKTLVYDFRLYKTALTDEQIQASVLNVGNTINALEIAYSEKPNALKSFENNQYKVVPATGGINIIGLMGNEKVSLFDVAGRQLQVANRSKINVNAGVYIVKINNEVTKVVVK
jgi:hypothetical protein